MDDSDEWESISLENLCLNVIETKLPIQAVLTFSIEGEKEVAVRVIVVPESLDYTPDFVDTNGGEIN